MKNILFVAATAAILFFAGCKKKEPQNPGTYCSDRAILCYENRVIPDICPLCIVIDSSTYLPVNVDSSFTRTNSDSTVIIDTVAVNICYTLTGDSDRCGFTNIKYPEIKITSMQRR